MERREFLKQSALAAAAAASTKVSAAMTPVASIARRPLGKTGEHLSIIGFGGIVVMNEDTGHSNNIVAEAVDRGVNYFDVAPSYGDAQERLGPALAPYRKN
ncbi:MAG TPA: aldo/keto reductase, partial [Edaphobacter sp.]|nr:aldo/keto reductase [Edaphobacter sp.]